LTLLLVEGEELINGGHHAFCHHHAADRPHRVDFEPLIAVGVVPPGFAERVHASWPRHDVGYALAEVIARQIEANPAKGPPLTFPGHVHQLLYPTTPAVTWFDVVRTAGWNDQPNAGRSNAPSPQGAAPIA
jgi:hypothetical protein